MVLGRLCQSCRLSLSLLLCVYLRWLARLRARARVREAGRLIGPRARARVRVDLVYSLLFSSPRRSVVSPRARARVRVDCLLVG